MMYELLRDWLIGVTCAAIIVALAQTLMPEGAAKRAGRLTGGLVLLLAVLQPVFAFRPGLLTEALSECRLELDSCEQELQAENREAMKGIIEEKAAAYIVDKAAQMGIQCRVAVETADGMEYPVPAYVSVTGLFTDDERQALAKVIEEDFALPASCQEYRMEAVDRNEAGVEKIQGAGRAALGEK